MRSEGCGSDFISSPFSLSHRWIDSCSSCPWPQCPRVDSAQPWNFWVWRPPRVCVKCGDPGGTGLGRVVLYTSANPQSGQGRTRASLTSRRLVPMTTVATRPLILARPGVCVKGGGWGGQAEARGGGKGVFLRHHRITGVRVGWPLQDQHLA